MNANHSFSRRLFAEFIATRVKAWRLERSGPPTGAVPAPASEARRDGSGLDVRSPLLPGLPDPQRSRGLGIG